MEFGEAFKILIRDPVAHAYREGWNAVRLGRKVWITLEKMDYALAFIYHDPDAPRTDPPTWVWMPSMADLIATDWRVESAMPKERATPDKPVTPAD